jgi:hypothetical protein
MTVKQKSEDTKIYFEEIKILLLCYFLRLLFILSGIMLACSLLPMSTQRKGAISNPTLPLTACVSMAKFSSFLLQGADFKSTSLEIIMWTLRGNNYWQNLTFIKGFKCSAM